MKPPTGILRRPHLLRAVAGLLTCTLGLALLPLPAPDDLEDARRALQQSPDDPKLLMDAAEAAFSEDDDDAALWYAELARLMAGDGREAKAVDKRLKALREEVGVELPSLGTASGAYAKSIFQLAKLCQSAKLYANCADLLGGLEGTPYGEDAASRLEKLFKNKKALEAMLESGVPVKVSTRQRRSAREIARIDAKHVEWDEAFELKGKNYTIKTNMGVEMAEAILSAMEQMNRFYRKIFDYKKGGGSMRRCEVRVWKTRDEFDAYNPGTGPTVGGFYSPSENSVSTYDPRTADGFMQQPIEELWSTLYHEASHQFTRMVWKALIPTWLNEGTASYFEGAAILPGGFVETNRIPESRLRNVVYQIGGKNPEDPVGVDELDPALDAVDLWDVVTYFQPGSYPGSHYSFGWAMVYFCMNYENDSCERVYEPIYKDFMRSYTDSGEERNVGKRFKKYFVEEAELPGVESYEDLERRWQAWILELSRIEFGGPEQADVLIERARKQLEFDKLEYAVDSLRWALRKRPDDPLALRLLGETLTELKGQDAALFAFRRLVAVGRAQADREAPLKHYDGTGAEAVAAGLAGIKKVNRSLGEIMQDGYDAFVEDAVAEADGWVEAGYPRVALQSLTLASDVVGGEGALLARAAELRESAGVDIRRVRRLPVPEDLEGWERSGEWAAIAEEDGTTGLRCSGDYAEATFAEAPPKTFLFEVDVLVEDLGDFPVLGITFAGTVAGSKSYVRLGKSGRAGILDYDDQTGRPTFAPQFKAKSRMKAGETFTMGIDVGLNAARFLIDGKEVGKIEGSPSSFAGRLGLMTTGTPVRFLNPRLTR
ncbi:MAG: hypothetical protein PVJ89_05245 [Planctomycetota bacterium]|jgi:hypothetical protein